MIPGTARNPGISRGTGGRGISSKSSSPTASPHTGVLIVEPQMLSPDRWVLRPDDKPVLHGCGARRRHKHQGRHDGHRPLDDSGFQSSEMVAKADAR